MVKTLYYPHGRCYRLSWPREICTLIVCLAALGLAEARADAAQENDDSGYRPLPLEEAHIHDLRKGGHVLFLRHAEREHGIPGMELVDLAEHVPDVDRPAEDMPGHCLTEAGKESARVLGQMLETLDVPIGRVYSSPICRARQTARLAFDRLDNKVEVLSFVHHNYGDEDTVRHHGQRLRNFLREHVRDDTNLVMSAHGNMLSPLDVDYDDLEELGFIIFDSDLKPVARANPGEFAALIYAMEVPQDATGE